MARRSPFAIYRPKIRNSPPQLRRKADALVCRIGQSRLLLVTVVVSFVVVFIAKILLKVLGSVKVLGVGFVVSFVLVARFVLIARFALVVRFVDRLVFVVFGCEAFKLETFRRVAKAPDAVVIAVGVVVPMAGVEGLKFSASPVHRLP